MLQSITNSNLWVKKFYRKKWKYLLLGVAIFFIIIQLGNMSILGFANESSNQNQVNTNYRQHTALKKVLSKWEEPQHSKMMKDPNGNAISLRGTRDKDILKYFPNVKGKFTCFGSKQEIDYIKVNDDYCDCPEDGSDEPGTNACINGVFYCEKSSKKFAVKIASYKVNDGYCDCCDGSDEWQQIPFPDSDNVSRNTTVRYHITHCENHCKDK